jgi:hypothetical protein
MFNFQESTIIHISQVFVSLIVCVILFDIDTQQFLNPLTMNYGEI